MGFMESWSPSRAEGDWEAINNSGARKRKSQEEDKEMTDVP